MTRLLMSWPWACALSLTIAACGGQPEGEVGSADNELRAALSSDEAQLEALDLQSLRATARHLIDTASGQGRASVDEALPAQEGRTPIEIAAEIDARRAEAGQEPLIVTKLSTSSEGVHLSALPVDGVLTPERLRKGCVEPTLRVGDDFSRERSELLGGRSEAEVVEGLTSALAELGRLAAPEVNGWAIMRRVGLSSGVVFLVEDGVVELNPAFVHFLAVLSRPQAVILVGPSPVATPERRAPSSDWEILVRWLEGAEPADAPISVNRAVAQDENTDPTPSPTPLFVPGCPCCACSAFGLGLGGPIQGLAAFTTVLLPLGLLLALRRRS